MMPKEISNILLKMLDVCEKHNDSLTDIFKLVNDLTQSQTYIKTMLEKYILDKSLQRGNKENGNRQTE